MEIQKTESLRHAGIGPGNHRDLVPQPDQMPRQMLGMGLQAAGARLEHPNAQGNPEGRARIRP